MSEWERERKRKTKGALSLWRTTHIHAFPNAKCEIMLCQRSAYRGTCVRNSECVGLCSHTYICCNSKTHLNMPSASVPKTHSEVHNKTHKITIYVAECEWWTEMLCTHTHDGCDADVRECTPNPQTRADSQFSEWTEHVRARVVGDVCVTSFPPTPGLNVIAFIWFVSPLRWNASSACAVYAHIGNDLRSELANTHTRVRRLRNLYLSSHKPHRYIFTICVTFGRARCANTKKEPGESRRETWCMAMWWALLACAVYCV